MSDSPRVSLRGAGACFLWRKGAPPESLLISILFRKQGGEGWFRGRSWGANPVSSLWERVAHSKGQIKRLSWRGRAAQSWEARLLISHNLCFSQVGEWDRGKAPELRPVRRAPVLLQSEWIPQPLSHLPEASPPGRTTLEGGNSEKMRCHVPRCDRGRVCANSNTTWGR